MSSEDWQQHMHFRQLMQLKSPRNGILAQNKDVTHFEEFVIILDKRLQLTPDGSHCIRSLHCDRLVEQNQIAESLTVGPGNKKIWEGC